MIAITLIIELEGLERKFALSGETDAPDLETYACVASSMRRLLESIGLQCQPRGAGPSLSDIIHIGGQP